MKSVFDYDSNLTLREADASRLVWRSVKERAFGTYGSDALHEEGFCRLTAKERDVLRPLNDGEAWLAEQSAGIQVRFQTNSSRIFLRVKLNGRFNMTNMTQIGQCGADLYVSDEKMGFVLHEVARFAFDGDGYEVSLGHFAGQERKERQYILYLPLYIAVKSCEIGLDEDATLSPFGFSRSCRVAVYGTSITQGCCASRPGLAYTNILSRKLDIAVENYGFSGTAFMEREMGTFLGKRAPDVLFVDVEPNAGVDERLEQNAEGFLDEFLRRSPQTAVVIYSRVLFAMDRYDDYRVRLREHYAAFLKRIARAYAKKGYRVHFADGSRVFPDNFTEYTCDGLHPSDAGMFCLAKSYCKQLMRLKKLYGLDLP